MVTVLNIGSKAALIASERIYKVISERQEENVYYELIKFYDNGTEIELPHPELCSLSRYLSEKEQKKYEGK